MTARASAARGLVWVAASTLVVLTARTLAYALVPSPSLVSNRFEAQVGGPSLVVVGLVSLGLTFALAAALVWIVAVAVRERRALERIPVVEEPRLPLGRLAVRALGLWLASSLAFALLESYLHWRAGLGWHGIRCLAGPVHRDAIPILAGLSVVAAAVLSALELLVAWARRVFALLRARPGLSKATSPLGPVVGQAHRPESLLFSLGARAPPSRRATRTYPHRPEGITEMRRRIPGGRRVLVPALAGAAALVLAAGASAHAEISPAVAKAKAGQVFTLAVPTEKEDAFTTKVELTPPEGFSIDSFAPSPGWKRTVQQTGSGEETVIQDVTWSGGHVPTEEDAFFQFLATADSSKTYTFKVRQTYSDGSVVDWAGPESSDTPAPTLESVSSLGGGGGTSTLTIVALILGAAGLIVGIVALVSRGGRAIA